MISTPFQCFVTCSFGVSVTVSQQGPGFFVILRTLFCASKNILERVPAISITRQTEGFMTPQWLLSMDPVAWSLSKGDGAPAADNVTRPPWFPQLLGGVRAQHPSKRERDSSAWQFDVRASVSTAALQTPGPDVL